jgi:hypothetical protein
MTEYNTAHDTSIMNYLSDLSDRIDHKYNIRPNVNEETASLEFFIPIETFDHFNEGRRLPQLLQEHIDWARTELYNIALQESKMIPLDTELDLDACLDILHAQNDLVQDMFWVYYDLYNQLGEERYEFLIKITAFYNYEGVLTFRTYYNIETGCFGEMYNRIWHETTSLDAVEF